MIKFRTGRYAYQIRKIEIDRETNNFVFVGKDRYAKRSSYYNFFDSWDEAKEFLLEKAEKQVEYCSHALELAHSKLNNVSELIESK